ncbi:MAG: 3-oxoacyl-ACP reductase FabG [Burkholderiaceae bacterium]|jgi:3-oxoacyl-[acyl-carrier protein] reductase|nr:3-oxoacyl-ACP reductase FabG [Burkholderiaceae bacterium]
MNSQQQRKLVVVTGGTRGIGRGIVERLSHAGYDMVFTYANSEDAAQAMVKDADAVGRRMHGYRCDARSNEDVDAFVSKVLGQHGRPYALINNVGITHDAILVNMPPQSWFDVIDSNINSVYRMTHRLLPPMLESGDGCVIQISSVSGLRGNRGQTNYSATKSALLGFTRALSTEVARFNIRVNAIAPGLIATEMVEQMPAARQQAMAKSIPLRRIGSADDVGAAAEFLLSAGASYITGQTIVVDGGMTA